MWGYRVVPWWAHGVSFQIERSHLGISHTDTRSVGRTSQASAYLQASLRGGGSDKTQQQLQAAQWNPRPVATHLTEEPMLDRIPLRAAAREMTHR